MEGVGYPAGVAIADACAGGCVLGSERRLKRPEEHMPPRLGRKLPSIKISAEGRDQSSESYVLYSTARVICTAVAAVKKLRVYCERLYIRFVIRTVPGIWYTAAVSYTHLTLPTIYSV